MKYLIIILFLLINSCFARELRLKDPILDFNKINAKKIFINETYFDKQEYKDISKEINNELVQIFKNNNGIVVVSNKIESDIYIESKVIEFLENIYLDQINSPYLINNNLNNSNSVSLQLNLLVEIKILSKDKVLLDEKINSTELVQLNNINNSQLNLINNRNNTFYLDLKNKLIQNIIKKISYYISPSYIYINVSEN